MKALLAIGLMLALVLAGCAGTNTSSQKTSADQQGVASDTSSDIDTSNCLKCAGTYEITTCKASVSCMTDNYSNPAACKQIVGKIKSTTKVPSRDVNQEVEFAQNDVNDCLFAIAIRDKNVGICKETTNHVVCVKKYAEQTKDSSVCIKELENTDRLDCIVQQIGVTGDVSLCKLLPSSNEEQQIECYNRALGIKNYFINYDFAVKCPSASELIGTSAYKGLCRFSLLNISDSLLDSSDVCQKLFGDATVSGDFIRECKTAITVKKGNISMCKEIKDESLPGCMYQIAVTNPSITVNDCYMNFTTRDNIPIIDKLSNNCILGVAIRLNDTSLCKMMKEINAGNSEQTCIEDVRNRIYSHDFDYGPAWWKLGG